MPVAIRAWDGTRWVAPRYNIGTTDAPVWQGYNPGDPFVPHMDDTFGGVGDKEWVDKESGTTPEGDGYIYSERSGLNRLQDVVQPPPALQNVGKTARILIVARVEMIAGSTTATTLAGCYLKFEVWDALSEFGAATFAYQTGEFPDTVDTGWVTYEPPGMYAVRTGVPEFHKVILDGMTDDITTRLSLSRWTVIDAATETIMGYNPLNQTEIVPRFWDGTAWVPQTMD